MEKSEEKYHFKKRRVKTPTVIQMEITECGAACLCIILAYFKKYLTLEELRIACGITRDGSKASYIVSAAEDYGLIAEGFSTTLPALDDIALPAILFWNFEHFIVLEGFDERVVYINDPATGPRAIDYQDFDLSYSGVVLTFEKGPDFVPSGRPKSVIKSLLEQSKLIKDSLVFILIGSIASIIPGLAQPAFSQVFIDQIIMEGNFDWIWWIIGGMLSVFVLSTILGILQATILYRTQTRLSVILSTKSFWKMITLPFIFFTLRNPGEIAFRLSANSTISGTVSTKLVPIVINMVMVLAYGIALFYYDLTMAGLALVSLGLNLWTIKRVNRMKMDAYARFQSDTGKFTSFALGVIGNIGNVKEMGMEYKIFSKLAGYYTKIVNSGTLLALRGISLEILPGLLNGLLGIFILAVGCMKIISGTFSVGMLFAVQLLMGNFTRPIMALVGMAENIQFLKMDMDRIDDINLFPVKEEKIEAPNIHIQRKLDGYLQFTDVSFSYGPLTPPVLKHINFELSPGKSIALVGPTGSGKSTIAKLVSGLYDPTEGVLLFDNKKREEIPKMTINYSLSVVEQNPFLFKGTLKDNLTLFDPEIHNEDIIKATNDACISNVILSRKGGYEFIVEQGGANLSGGQRQCLEVARALARNPTILVLDEATSSLDSEIEFDIINNVRRRGIALLMIAHRLSTIKTCDEIIVLERGIVTGKGTHAELKSVPGIYQDLVKFEGSQKLGVV